MTDYAQTDIVEVGRVLEFTEEDRQQLHKLAVELVSMLERKAPGVAVNIFAMQKITRTAILRSHAS